MADLVVIFIIALILTLATAKILTDKKKGIKCSGCPYGNKAVRSGKCSCDH